MTPDPPAAGHVDEREVEAVLGRIADLAKYLSEPAWNLEGCARVGAEIYRLAIAALDAVRADAMTETEAHRWVDEHVAPPSRHLAHTLVSSLPRVRADAAPGDALEPDGEYLGAEPERLRHNDRAEVLRLRAELERAKAFLAQSQEHKLREQLERAERERDECREQRVWLKTARDRMRQRAERAEAELRQARDIIADLIEGESPEEGTPQWYAVRNARGWLARFSLGENAGDKENE